MEEHRIRLSHGDGAEAEPELEFRVNLMEDPSGSWTATSAPGSARLPGELAVGPVVVTLLDRDGHTCRSEAVVRVDDDIVVLEGTSPFVTVA